MELPNLLSILCILFTTENSFGSPCRPKQLQSGESVVCECSATYCDTTPPIGKFSRKEAVVFLSDLKGQRLNRSLLKWTNRHKRNDLEILINPSISYQKILGFGGAFTDAAGINIAKLTPGAQRNLIESYFGPKGIRYSIGRVPMGSCDFSSRKYTYDDVVGDFDLKMFKLAREDLQYKIPFIKMARNLTKSRLKLFGSPWTAPAWLKTSGKLAGNGTLKGKAGDKNHKTWAKYFVKFLQAYGSHNLTFWGLTVQNEPTTGFIYNYTFQTMGLNPEMSRDFIKSDLGPALHSAGFQDIKLMILDDQRLLLPQWARVVLSDPEAAQFVSGVGVHWYLDKTTPPSLLDATHRLFPKHFLLATEACTGPGVRLGNWGRGEEYANDIIQDLSHWVTGWTDWNLALDPQGGPNWVRNFHDSPIIVNASADVFYKQPMFYALAHFSAFIPPGSERVGMRLNGRKEDVSAVAFRRPDKKRVLVVLNRSEQEKSVQLAVINRPNRYLRLKVLPRSILTLLWKKQ